MRAATGEYDDIVKLGMLTTIAGQHLVKQPRRLFAFSARTQQKQLENWNKRLGIIILTRMNRESSVKGWAIFFRDVRQVLEQASLWKAL